jgi:hypothetical protein
MEIFLHLKKVGPLSNSASKRDAESCLECKFPMLLKRFQPELGPLFYSDLDVSKVQIKY